MIRIEPREAWAWWTGELTAMLPRRSSRTVLKPDVIELRLRGGDICAPPRADESEALLALSADAVRGDRALARCIGRKPVVLSIDPADCLIERATYPAGALGRMADILRLDIARLTPF